MKKTKIIFSITIILFFFFILNCAKNQPAPILNSFTYSFSASPTEIFIPGEIHFVLKGLENKENIDKYYLDYNGDKVYDIISTNDIDTIIVFNTAGSHWVYSKVENEDYTEIDSIYVIIRDPNGEIINFSNGYFTFDTADNVRAILEYGDTYGGSNFNHYVYEREFSRHHTIKPLLANQNTTYKFRIRLVKPDGTYTYITDSDSSFTMDRDNKVNLMEYTVLNISEGEGIGDAIFIKFPNGKTMLIDSGSYEKEEYIKSFFATRNISYLDAALLTHMHIDHYGGFMSSSGGLISTFPIHKFYLQSSTFSNYIGTMNSIKAKLTQNQIPYTQLQTGEYINIDPNVTIKVLHSGVLVENDPEENNSSVALKITYGNVDILSGGDAQWNGENGDYGLEDYMIQNYGTQLDVEIYKVHHHGVVNGSSAELLQKLTPLVSIVSADAGSANPGQEPLPTTAVINRIRNVYSDLFRTDKANIYSNSFKYRNISTFNDGNFIEVYYNK